MKNHDEQNAGTVKTPESASGRRDEWQEPRLEFVEPELVRHGDMKELTAQTGFFGTFVPD